MICTMQNGKHVSNLLKGDGGDKSEPTTEISFLWLQEHRIDNNTSSTGKTTKQQGEAEKRKDRRGERAANS